MKPKNLKDYRKALTSFFVSFFLLIVIFSLCGFFTVKIGNEGIAVLEQKYAEYTAIFEKQATLSNEIENIIKHLYQLKRKDRTLSQHRQFQMIISTLGDNALEEIKGIHKIKHGTSYEVASLTLKDSLSRQEQSMKIYVQMLEEVKEIQSTIDQYEEDSEEYNYYQDLLEKCIDKYKTEATKTAVQKRK